MLQISLSRGVSNFLNQMSTQLFATKSEFRYNIVNYIKKLDYETVNIHLFRSFIDRKIEIENSGHIRHLAS